MTNEDMKRIERNLSRSALTAKPFYVRGMTGLTETEQGYFSIMIVPVYNPITGETVPLEVALLSLEEAYRDYLATKEELRQVKSEFQEFKALQDLKIKETNEKFDDLTRRVQDIELFNLD